jgi:hypothetical protein
MGLMPTGLATAFNGGFTYFDSTTSKNKHKGMGAVIAGGALAAGCIPIAISSMVNNRMGSLLLQSQTTCVTPPFYLRQTTNLTIAYQLLLPIANYDVNITMLNLPCCSPN